MKRLLRHAVLLGMAALAVAACAVRQTPAGGNPPTGYADTLPSAPLFLRAPSAPAPVGRGAAEPRRLARRGREFMRGVAHVLGPLPVRENVWWGDAASVAAGGDSVVFATSWVPASRLWGSIRCPQGDAASRRDVRLAAVVRDAAGDLVVEAWLETTGEEGCLGNAGARERVRAFADDVEMFARGVARLGVPVPAG